METVRSRSKWKGIVIAMFVMALLASLLWLFQRPAQRARDIVFGGLGRRSGDTNAVTRFPEGASPPSFGDQASGQMGSNAAPSLEASHDHENQSAAGTASRSSNSGSASNASLANNHPASSASSSNQAPSPSALRPSHGPPTASFGRGAHNKASFFEDDSQSPEPVNKESTATLLAAAKAAGRGPDNPIPARTTDLLGNDAALYRMFDADAGSNVVFIVDNSMSMMTHGKSVIAREAVAQTLDSMNARQTFYVLLFHTGGYEGMPSLGPLPATPENVHAMTNWLFNVGHRTGADPTKAVQRALGLTPAPDTVWLLSDSELPNESIDNIRDANAAVNAHINTIGFYNRDSEAGLRRVADENRGAYRFIPPLNAPAP